MVFAGIVTVGHVDALVSFGEIREEVLPRLKLQVFLIVIQGWLLLCLPRRSYSLGMDICRTLSSSGLAQGGVMGRFWRDVWLDDQGQDIAEYAVMLAVVLVIVVGTVRLIGSNANNVFSQVGSALQ